MKSRWRTFPRSFSICLTQSELKMGKRHFYLEDATKNSTISCSNKLIVPRTWKFLIMPMKKSSTGQLQECHDWAIMRVELRAWIEVPRKNLQIGKTKTSWGMTETKQWIMPRSTWVLIATAGQAVTAPPKTSRQIAAANMAEKFHDVFLDSQEFQHLLCKRKLWRTEVSKLQTLRQITNRILTTKAPLKTGVNSISVVKKKTTKLSRCSMAMLPIKLL